MANDISTAPQCIVSLATTQSQPVCQIPDYLLTDILIHLDTLTLLICRSVCHFWKWTTENRTHLKLLLFTQSPSSAPQKSYTLHPVFRRLGYHFRYFRNQVESIVPLGQRLDFRLNHHEPALSSVMDNYATAPAVREIVVRICGGEGTIRRAEGVRVWDLMAGFDELIGKQHSLPTSAPLHQHLAWDCVQFPFAGFRIIPSSMTDKVMLKPEFHNLVEITRRLSRCWMGGEALVTFDIDEVDDGQP